MKANLALILLIMTAPCLAEESTSLNRLDNLVPYSSQAYVNTKNCTQPIQSSPYVIVGGNGGANMRLTCPADHPVMYSWRQQFGYGGFISVQAGGGYSWITCCSLQQKWAPA